MKYFEFGQQNPELMVMLHGGGVLPVAREIAKLYHGVLVAYDAFNPDEPQTQFKSPMDEARRLGDYPMAAGCSKLEKPGLLPDWQKNGLFPVLQNRHAPMVWHSGQRG